MEVTYPQRPYNRETAFIENPDLTNYLQSEYFTLAEIKNTLPYSPETHAQYQHTLALLQGKQEMLQEILSNFK